MKLDELEGVTLEPINSRIAAEKVAEYVAATSDDPERWVDVAPPSYAGALLFRATPSLLARPDVMESTKVLVHVDQMFEWYRPLIVGSELVLASTVSRVRSRGGATFVTFGTEAVSDDLPLFTSSATFLLGAEAASEPGPDSLEPATDARGTVDVPGSGSLALAKSASRSDLVRYAGASGDFNSIHYDHAAARAAGLDGIVVHGLLMGAWLTQVASTLSPRSDPLANMRLRFRDALRPAEQAMVFGSVDPVSMGSCGIDLAVKRGDTRLVTGRAQLRMG